MTPHLTNLTLFSASSQGFRSVSQRSISYPIEEAEERFACMRRVQNRWKTQFSFLTGHPKELYKPLPQIIIATMMTMDLTMLVDATKHGHLIDNTLKSLFVMPCFFKIRKYRAVSSAYILLLTRHLIQS